MANGRMSAELGAICSVLHVWSRWSSIKDSISGVEQKVREWWVHTYPYRKVNHHFHFHFRKDQAFQLSTCLLNFGGKEGWLNTLSSNPGSLLMKDLSSYFESFSFVNASMIASSVWINTSHPRDSHSKEKKHLTQISKTKCEYDWLFARTLSISLGVINQPYPPNRISFSIPISPPPFPSGPFSHHFFPFALFLSLRSEWEQRGKRTKRDKEKLTTGKMAAVRIRKDVQDNIGTGQSWKYQFYYQLIIIS